MARNSSGSLFEENSRLQTWELEKEPRQRVSLILPAYNEEKHIGEVLALLRCNFPDAEIVVVSDGSRDKTAAIARSYGAPVNVIEYQPNRGKGYAVRTGMLAAQGDYVVFTDADLPFGVEGLRAVIEALVTNPEEGIVIASKVGSSRGLIYRVARAVARLAITLLTGLRYPDTQAGLKGFRVQVARDLYSRAIVDGFASDIEILYLARKSRFPVKLLPMKVRDDFARPSTFNLRAGFRLLADVVRMRVRHS